MVYSILEMSRRLNGYHNMILTNVALHNVSDKVIHFTPVTANFGETSIMKDEGTESMTTQRLADIFTEERIFFLKIDAEHSEEFVIGGFLNYFEHRMIAHFAMEVWSNQVPLVMMFYKHGYSCQFFDPNIEAGSDVLDKKLWTMEEAKGNVSARQGDIYCTWLI